MIRAFHLTAAALLALALLSGCAKERPRAAATIIVPVELGVNTVDVAGTYATVRQYLNGEGVKADRDRTDNTKGTFVSQPQRCAPVGDERHVTTCVFVVQVGESKSNPQQVAVEIRVRTGGPVDYDPKLAADQIVIEPLLDQMVSVLRARYTFAEVKRTDQLSF